MSDASHLALCEQLTSTKRKYFDTNAFILLSGISTALILICSCIFSLAFLYKEAVEDSQNSLTRLSVALSEQTALAFHEIDTVIKEVRSSFSISDLTTKNRESIHQELKRIYHGLLQGQALLIFDRSGQMFVHSRVYPTPDLNVADRTYFRSQIDSTKDDLFISSPLRNRVNDNWMISVSRRMVTPEGKFGGVIMAAIDMNYFNRLYRSLNLPPQAQIELLKTDGTLLAALPFDPAKLGVLQPLGKRGPDSLQSSSQAGDFPLLIALSLPRKVALRQWYHLVWVLCPGAFAVLVGIGLLTGTLLFLVNKDRKKACQQQRLLEEQVEKRTSDLTDLLEFNKTIIKTSPIGIAVYTHDGQCVTVNDVFSRIDSIDKQQLVSQTMESLRTLATSGLLDQAGQTLETGLTTRHEGCFQTGAGRQKWIDYQVVRFSRNKIKHLLLLLSDITDRKHMEEELRTLAFTDSLTGVNNRRRLLELANGELARVQRNGRPFSFLILDIDYFKDVNDTFGHDQGDRVLKGLAAVCLRELRSTDIFGRLGGEEFGAVLIESPPDEALAVAERLRTSVAAASIDGNEQPITITISVGLAFRRGNDDKFHNIMQRADKALYAAKNQGRNRVVHG
jgi:diguanylate cyclase (GGDEF)-like protein/PAS domain S-box-containing protein